MSGALALRLGLTGAPGVINRNAGAYSAAQSGGASVNVNANGTLSGSGHPGANWVTPTNSTTAAAYQVKVDATAGTFSLGTTGTWIDCSTGPGWSKAVTGSVTFTISFREKATTLVRATIAGEVLDAT